MWIIIIGGVMSIVGFSVILFTLYAEWSLRSAIIRDIKKRRKVVKLTDT